MNKHSKHFRSLNLRQHALVFCRGSATLSLMTRLRKERLELLRIKSLEVVMSLSLEMKSQLMRLASLAQIWMILKMNLMNTLTKTMNCVSVMMTKLVQVKIWLLESTLWTPSNLVLELRILAFLKKTFKLVPMRL